MKLANVIVPSCFLAPDTCFAIKFNDQMLQHLEMHRTYRTETREKKKKLAMILIVLFVVSG
jgi:hypothetical protein